MLIILTYFRKIENGENIFQIAWKVSLGYYIYTETYMWYNNEKERVEIGKGKSRNLGTNRYTSTSFQ